MTSRLTGILVHWRIYASLGFSKLINKILTYIYCYAWDTQASVPGVKNPTTKFTDIAALYLWQSANDSMTFSQKQRPTVEQNRGRD